MFSFGFSLVIAALVGMILYSYLRNRKVSAPRLPGNDGGNIGYAAAQNTRNPRPNTSTSRAAEKHSSTSSTAAPPHRKSP